MPSVPEGGAGWAVCSMVMGSIGPLPAFRIYNKEFIMFKEFEKIMSSGIYWLTQHLWIDRVRRKYLGRVTGLENLPERGPYVIVANHASFMDHFVLAAVFRFWLGEKVYFLTKKESFETPWSRLWHNAMGAIPVDRNGPSKSQIRRIKDLLGEGRVVVIYPEGTRSDGRRLLPFKIGAFKIAARMGVDIVPVGLAGSAQVLPKGHILARQGRVDVAFGTPLESRQTEALLEAAHRSIQVLAFGDGRRGSGSGVAGPSLPVTARIAEALEAILEDGIDVTHQGRLSRLWRRLALCPQTVESLIVGARIRGLLSFVTPPPQRFVHAVQALRMAKRVLRSDARHPMAHYIVAIFQESVPGLCWWWRHARRIHLAQAHHDATAYGYRSDTFQLAYARALIDVGERELAERLLKGLLDSLPTDALNPRQRRRGRQAGRLLDSLQVDGA